MTDSERIRMACLELGQAGRALRRDHPKKHLEVAQMRIWQAHSLLNRCQDPGSADRALLRFLRRNLKRHQGVWATRRVVRRSLKRIDKETHIPAAKDERRRLQELWIKPKLEILSQAAFGSASRHPDRLA